MTGVVDVDPVAGLRLITQSSNSSDDILVRRPFVLGLTGLRTSATRGQLHDLTILKAELPLEECFYVRDVPHTPAEIGIIASVRQTIGEVAIHSDQQRLKMRVAHRICHRVLVSTTKECCGSDMIDDVKQY
jgi:hypothetical protein